MAEVPQSGGTPMGSPEDLLEQGALEGDRIIGGWVDHVIRSLRGVEDPGEASQVIGQAGEELDPGPLVNSLERLDLRGQMLGAGDAEWEAENQEIVTPAEFARGFSGSAAHRRGKATTCKMPNWTQKPFAPAVDDFMRKKVVTRSIFQKMGAAAKRRAFNVAGATRRTVIQAFHDELAATLREGGDLRSFRAKLKQRMQTRGWLRPGPKREVPTRPMRPWHIETIYRTNVHGSYARGRQAQMTQPAVVAARPFWQVVTLRADGKSRPTHAAAHGKVLRWDDPFWSRAPLPWGFNCFLPGTMVQGAVVGASRADYSGQAVELTTAEGRRLAVTAQHPVLTDSGLRKAVELRKGDKLLCYRREIADRPSCSHLDRRDPDEQNRPASAEEVFRALADASDGSSATVAAGPDDFHGEAKRFHGKVHVVGSYRELLLHPVAEGFDLARKLPLEATYPGESPLVRPGSSEHLGTRSGAPSAGIPGGGALALDGSPVVVGRSPSVPFEALRFGTAAKLNPCRPETTGEDVAGYAAFVGKLLHAGSGDVLFDEIVEVREFDFCGHVYDFQTETGWIVAGDVFASNCRCRVVSRSAADVERRGLTVSTGADLSGLPDPGWSGASQMPAPPAIPPAPKPQPKAPPPAPAKAKPAGRPELIEDDDSAAVKEMLRELEQSMDAEGRLRVADAVPFSRPATATDLEHIADVSAKRGGSLPERSVGLMPQRKLEGVLVDVDKVDAAEVAEILRYMEATPSWSTHAPKKSRLLHRDMVPTVVTNEHGFKPVVTKNHAVFVAQNLQKSSLQKELMQKPWFEVRHEIAPSYRTPVAHESAKARAWAFNDVMEETDEKVKTMRQRLALQDLLAEDGVSSYDNARGLDGAVEGTISVKKGTYGTHGWNGRVRIDPAVQARANSFMRKLGNAPITPNEAKAFNTLVHEEYHGLSPIAKEAYRGIGVGMEEASTEILAQRIVLKKLKQGHAYSRVKNGTGYRGWVRGMTRVCRDHGYSLDEVEDALLAIRRGAYRGIKTPEAHVNAFVRQLTKRSGKLVDPASATVPNKRKQDKITEDLKRVFRGPKWDK